MSHRVEAQHAQRRVHVATRLLALRAIGVGIGFLIAAPIVLVTYAIVTGGAR